MCEQVLAQGLVLGPHGSAGLPAIGQGLVLPNGSAMTPILATSLKPHFLTHDTTTFYPLGWILPVSSFL